MASNEYKSRFVGADEQFETPHDRGNRSFVRGAHLLETEGARAAAPDLARAVESYNGAVREATSPTALITLHSRDAICLEVMAQVSTKPEELIEQAKEHLQRAQAIAESINLDDEDNPVAPTVKARLEVAEAVVLINDPNEVATRLNEIGQTVNGNAPRDLEMAQTVWRPMAA